MACWLASVDGRRREGSAAKDAADPIRMGGSPGQKSVLRTTVSELAGPRLNRLEGRRRNNCFE